MDPLTETRFWLQIVNDSRCTVMCPLDLESRVKGWVDARCMGGLITVIASKYMRDNEIWIIDDPGLEAVSNQAVQRIGRSWGTD